jgi:TonB family protein
MILAVALFLAALASAQTNNARALLDDIAASARADKSWRAEGVEVSELTASGIQLRSEVHFKIAIQGPSRMRWETSGEDDTLMVCDGTDHWTYYSHGLSFYRNPVNVSPCKPALGDYSQLTDNLTGAITVGREQIQLAGDFRECDIVRAEYAVARSPESSLVRTLFIDTERRLVLRESSEVTNSKVRSIVTVRYSVMEHEPTLASDVFKFTVPTGTAEDEGPQGPPDDPIVEDGVYRVGPRVSHPTLLNKVEPSYTEEARQAQVSGIVLISLAVDPSGKPQRVTVVRGLGHGLNEKAIEAVREWSFRPGIMKDSVPVTVGITVAVNFRLP